MNSFMVKVGNNGRFVIPACLREELDIAPGDELVLTLVEGELRITTRRGAIARAQQSLRTYANDGRSLVDELIEERRAEADGGSPR